jgi:ubiquitin-conjugating enzyme E2 J2
MFGKAISRLSKEYEAIQRNPIPNAIIVPEEDNWLVWNFVLYGMDGDYFGGVYHGEIRFPNNFPMGPPAILMHTPSGRFVPGAKICVSMSNFHPETWSPVWSISSIVLAIQSFMYDTEQGVGTTAGTAAEKQKQASESFDFNQKSPKFQKLFQDYFYLFKTESLLKTLPKAPKRFNIKNIAICGISISVPIIICIAVYLYHY